MSTILQGRPEAASGFALLSRDGNEILTLDDDVAVLAKGRALHGEGGGSPSAGLGRRGSEDERGGAEEGGGGGGGGVRTCSKLWLCFSSSDMMVRREGKSRGREGVR